MRRFIVAAALVAASCGQQTGPAHPYPESARAAFDQSCPVSDPVCACTWAELTQRLSYEDYETAMRRFRTEGLMDPRVTRARTNCLGRN